MQHHRLVKTLWLVLVFTFCSVSSVGAFPPLPSSFYGTIQQDGENIPDGTLIEALIEGKVVAYSLSETYQGTSVFSLDVPGDDPTSDIVEGGTTGQNIEFRVGGALADSSTQWMSGVNENINLNISFSEVLSPTMSTFTPVPSQTPIPESYIPYTITQTAENNSGHGKLTVEINFTYTPIPLPTHVEILINQQDQSEFESNADPEENEDIPDASPDIDDVVALSNDERVAAADPLAAITDIDQEESMRNNTNLWIGLAFLLLICVIACVLVVRRKYRNEMDSFL